MASKQGKIPVTGRHKNVHGMVKFMCGVIFNVSFYYNSLLCFVCYQSECFVWLVVIESQVLLCHRLCIRLDGNESFA